MKHPRILVSSVAAMPVSFSLPSNYSSCNWSCPAFPLRRTLFSVRCIFVSYLLHLILKFGNCNSTTFCNCVVCRRIIQYYLSSSFLIPRSWFIIRIMNPAVSDSRSRRECNWHTELIGVQMRFDVKVKHVNKYEPATYVTVLAWKLKLVSEKSPFGLNKMCSCQQFSWLL
jgi:hypothetical protein